MLLSPLRRYILMVPFGIFWSSVTGVRESREQTRIFSGQPPSPMPPQSLFLIVPVSLFYIPSPLLHLTPSVPSTHVPNSWHKLFGLSFNKEARERKERGRESRERRDINCKERGGGWRRKEQFREGGRQRLWNIF